MMKIRYYIWFLLVVFMFFFYFCNFNFIWAFYIYLLTLRLLFIRHFVVFSRFFFCGHEFFFLLLFSRKKCLLIQYRFVSWLVVRRWISVNRDFCFDLLMSNEGPVRRFPRLGEWFLIKFFNLIYFQRHALSLRFSFLSSITVHFHWLEGEKRNI